MRSHIPYNIIILIDYNVTLLDITVVQGEDGTVSVFTKHLVEQGLLCRPLHGSLRSARGYYVVLPPRKRRGALIGRFVEWLEQERGQ